jgi:hypothetical protein
VRLMRLLERRPDPFDRNCRRFPRWHERRTIWKYTVAAAVVGACSLAFYQAGRMKGHGFPIATRLANPSRNILAADPSAPQTPLSSRQETAEQENEMVALKEEVARVEREKVALRNRLATLDGQLASEGSHLEQARQENADLETELAAAQTNARDLQARLSAISNQTARDTEDLLVLKTKIKDLTTVLEGKDQEIVRDLELLEHDRDIRNLIGARDLYIAEIYDVGKSGATEKPFGRVFYTKDKSLIFYGYDLDEQHGVKRDTSFQAWGRRRSDGEHDISLGLLYRDDSGNKRWVLRFNEPRTITDLDAIFITAEPEGGSAKPTGKPLLFTYLRLEPNHP